MVALNLYLFHTNEYKFSARQKFLKEALEVAFFNTGPLGSTLALGVHKEKKLRESKI